MPDGTSSRPANQPDARVRNQAPILSTACVYRHGKTTREVEHDETREPATGEEQQYEVQLGVLLPLLDVGP